VGITALRGYSIRQNQRSSRNRTVIVIEQASEIIAAPAWDMDFISKIKDNKQYANILQINLLFYIRWQPKIGFNNFCSIAEDLTSKLDRSSTTIICFGGSSIKNHHCFKLCSMIISHFCQRQLARDYN
jgi:hypothetical protein